VSIDIDTHGGGNAPPASTVTGTVIYGMLEAVRREDILN
jgi:hypothetical protein